jgi:flagellar hook-length control protein FliK
MTDTVFLRPDQEPKMNAEGAEPVHALSSKPDPSRVGANNPERIDGVLGMRDTKPVFDAEFRKGESSNEKKQPFLTEAETPERSKYHTSVVKPEPIHPHRRRFISPESPAVIHPRNEPAQPPILSPEDSKLQTASSVQAERIPPQKTEMTGLQADSVQNQKKTGSAEGDRHTSNSSPNAYNPEGKIDAPAASEVMPVKSPDRGQIWKVEPQHAPHGFSGVSKTGDGAEKAQQSTIYPKENRSWKIPDDKRPTDHAPFQTTRLADLEKRILQPAETMDARDTSSKTDQNSLTLKGASDGHANHESIGPSTGFTPDTPMGSGFQDAVNLDLEPIGKSERQGADAGALEIEQADPAREKAAFLNEFSKSVFNQVEEKLKYSVSKKISKINFELKPESLGHLRVDVSTGGDHISIRIVTETSSAREMIEKQIYQLKSNLQDSGLEIEKLEIFTSGDPEAHQHPGGYREKPWLQSDSENGKADVEDAGNKDPKFRKKPAFSRQTGIDYFA